MASELITYYLTEFVASIEDGDDERIAKHAYGVLRAFEETGTVEKRLLRRTTRSQSSLDIDAETRRSLASFSSDTTGVKLLRNGFVVTLVLYLRDEVSDEEMLTEARNLLEVEEGYAAEKEEAEAETDDRTPPATLTLLETGAPTDAVYPDETVVVQARVANTGGETASSARLAVTSADDVVVEPPVVDLGDLGPEETGVVTLTVTARSPGLKSVLVEVYDQSRATSDEEPVFVSVDDPDESVPTSSEAGLDQLLPIAGQLGALGLGVGAKRFYDSRDDSDDNSDEE